MDVDGMTCWLCKGTFEQAMSRLRQSIAQFGMTVFAEVDHARAAAEVGLELRPMQLLLFGDALGSTKLIHVAPTCGMDLPLRALVWLDSDNQTWLGYNEPGWIAARHGARAGNDRVLAAMRKAFTGIAEQVAQTGIDPGK